MINNSIVNNCDDSVEQSIGNCLLINKCLLLELGKDRATEGTVQGDSEPSRSPRGGEAMELDRLAAILNAAAALIRIALNLWEAVGDRRKEKRAKHKGSTR